jgi:hypothetical protein
LSGLRSHEEADAHFHGRAGAQSPEGGLVDRAPGPGIAHVQGPGRQKCLPVGGRDGARGGFRGFGSLVYQGHSPRADIEGRDPHGQCTGILGTVSVPKVVPDGAKASQADIPGGGRKRPRDFPTKVGGQAQRGHVRVRNRGDLDWAFRAVQAQAIHGVKDFKREAQPFPPIRKLAQASLGQASAIPQHHVPVGSIYLPLLSPRPPRQPFPVLPTQPPGRDLASAHAQAGFSRGRLQGQYREAAPGNRNPIPVSPRQGPPAAGDPAEDGERPSVLAVLGEELGENFGEEAVVLKDLLGGRGREEEEGRGGGGAMPVGVPL